jgi:hypothetical protein
LVSGLLVRLRDFSLNPSIDVDLDTVSPQSFPVKVVAIKDLIELGQKEMLDATGITQQGNSRKASTSKIPPFPDEPATLNSTHAGGDDPVDGDT